MFWTFVIETVRSIIIYIFGMNTASNGTVNMFTCCLMLWHSRMSYSSIFYLFQWPFHTKFSIPMLCKHLSSFWEVYPQVSANYLNKALNTHNFVLKILWKYVWYVKSNIWIPLDALKYFDIKFVIRGSYPSVSASDICQSFSLWLVRERSHITWSV